MTKHICKVSDCPDNFIIAEDVYSKSGSILVLKNTEINDYIRNKLLNFGIEQICIFDSLAVRELPPDQDTINSFKRDYITYVQTVKELINDLAAGKSLDFEKVNFISNSIYKQVKSNWVIIECINQLKLADRYTYTHSINVSLYAMLVGKWLKLEDSDLKKLILSGVLHDIGKTMVPVEILNKTSPLLDSDFEIIKKHPQYGYDLIKSIPQIDSNVKESVLTHHEKVNGTGYPFGIKGSKLCLYSKIISIADTYDAITSERVYRPKRTPFSAFGEFEAIGLGSGNFDVQILMCFFSNIARYYTGSAVKMEDGRTGKVVYVPPHCISAPVIQVGNDYIDLAVNKDIKVKELI